MKTLALALTAALVAAPALASDQLAAKYGVEGATVAELALIHSTVTSSDENMDFAVRGVIDRVNGDVVSTQSFGDSQLARSLGVTGTVAELAALKGAIDSSDENNDFAFNAAKARIGGDIVSTQSVGGFEQLRASVGAPEGASLAEVALAKSRLDSAND